ncbi:hypothetical protein B5X24_HaOG214365 [Helicoverpa armigera]|nr:hypothetical protein B5X24_HaOG214365 [Helicoverpa armigera]
MHHTIGSHRRVSNSNYKWTMNTSNGVYQVEHPIALQVAGLDKPKRKRGRPPKKPKSPEELAKELAAKEQEVKHSKIKDRDEEPSGKRRRKTPTRFKEAVQGKELERIFKEEGVTDGEDSEPEIKLEQPHEVKSTVPKEPEVIGHLEESGELVVVVKGKGRGRPKGPMRPTRKECAICGMEFTCTGRYMSHVAQHGPVLYQCGQCSETFTTRLHFNNHQKEQEHTGQNIIPCKKNLDRIRSKKNKATPETIVIQDEPLPNKTESPPVQIIESVILPIADSLPDLNPEPIVVEDNVNTEFLKTEGVTIDITSSPSVDCAVKTVETTPSATVTEKSDGVEPVEASPSGKPRLKCNHCEKTFSSKQSKSLHIKASHVGERPYACVVCGSRFAYPRSLALHAVTHRRHRAAAAKGYACDLCGKVPQLVTFLVIVWCSTTHLQWYITRKLSMLDSVTCVTNVESASSISSCCSGTSWCTRKIDRIVVRFVSRGSWSAHVRRAARAWCPRWPHARGSRCAHCPKPECATGNKHKKQVHKQVSLLATTNLQGDPVKIEQVDSPQIEFESEQTISLPEPPSPVKLLEETPDDELEERVIYVTYDVDEADSPAFHILDPEQAAGLQDGKMLTTCELYSGPSLLVPQPEYEHLELEQDQLELEQEQLQQEDIEQLPEDLVLDHDQNIPVTDEQGNPLHFTMQDGTRLAITSADGKSLQASFTLSSVITQDGQTIPVEINGYADEEEVDNPDTIVHQLNLQKSIDSNVSSPVTHYFTIV